MITPQSLITQFRAALNDHWGYIWGTAGEQWTEAKQKALEQTTDDDRAQGRAYGSKWIGHTVADCSGLFSWAFKKLGGSMYHGSDTMFRKYCVNKGELKKGKRTDRATLKPGTAVFVWNGKTYSHVGLYVGDNTVIEAMSTIRGVTTSKATAGKWTHWGELSGVDYAADNSQSKDLKDHATIRRGSKGDAVKECQTLLEKAGYSVGSWGIDGDFGKDECLTYVVANLVANIVAWGLIAPIGDIVIYKEDARLVFTQGLVAGAGDFLFAVIIGGLLLYGYAKTIAKSGSLDKE